MSSAPTTTTAQQTTGGVSITESEIKVQLDSLQAQLHQMLEELKILQGQ